MRRARDIPAAIVILRLRIAERYGARKEVILHEAGIEPERISIPTNRITVEEALRVWESILKHTGAHEIGLVCGQEIRLHALGMLGYAMLNSTDMEKAFDKLCQHQRLVMSIALWNKYERDGKTT